MVKYDAIAILSSNDPNKHGLTGISKERLDMGLGLIYTQRIKNVVLLGRLSESMGKYLIENDIPRERIVLDNISRDTIGNIVVLETLLRRQNNWESVALVSSDFHIDRVRHIKDSLYPGKFQMDYFGVESIGTNRVKRKEQEEFSLKLFKRDFGGVEPWADIEIIRRLIEVHEVYRNLENRNNIKSRLMRTL